MSDKTSTSTPEPEITTTPLSGALLDNFNNLKNRLKYLSVIDRQGQMVGVVEDLILTTDHSLNLVISQTEPDQPTVLLDSKFIQRASARERAVYIDALKADLVHLPTLVTDEQGEPQVVPGQTPAQAEPSDAVQISAQPLPTADQADVEMRQSPAVEEASLPGPTEVAPEIAAQGSDLPPEDRQEWMAPDAPEVQDVAQEIETQEVEAAQEVEATQEAYPVGSSEVQVIEQQPDLAVVPAPEPEQPELSPTPVSQADLPTEAVFPSVTVINILEIENLDPQSASAQRIADLSDLFADVPPFPQRQGTQSSGRKQLSGQLTASPGGTGTIVEPSSGQVGATQGWETIPPVESPLSTNPSDLESVPQEEFQALLELDESDLFASDETKKLRQQAVPSSPQPAVASPHSASNAPAPQATSPLSPADIADLFPTDVAQMPLPSQGWADSSFSERYVEPQESQPFPMLPVNATSPEVSGDVLSTPQGASASDDAQSPAGQGSPEQQRPEPAVAPMPESAPVASTPSSSAIAPSSPTEAIADETATTIPLVEEQVLVDYVRRKIGEVIVRKRVETRMIQVPVRYEKLVIEQVSPDYRQLAEVDLSQGDLPDLELTTAAQTNNAVVSGEFTTPEAARQLLDAIILTPSHRCNKIRVEIELEDPSLQAVYLEWLRQYGQS